MKSSTMVPVSAVVIDAQTNRRDGALMWKIKARVVHVLSEELPKLPAENAGWLSLLKFVGTNLELRYSGAKLKNLVLRPGTLFRVAVSTEQVGLALEQVARGEQAVLSIEPDILRPMDEPCVRVPLSLLKELRGQEAGTEFSRRALVQTWSEDRKTGTAAGA